jgi:hypothetical protein
MVEYSDIRHHFAFFAAFRDIRDPKTSANDKYVFVRMRR